MNYPSLSSLGDRLFFSVEDVAGILGITIASARIVPGLQRPIPIFIQRPGGSRTTGRKPNFLRMRRPGQRASDASFPGVAGLNRTRHSRQAKSLTGGACCHGVMVTADCRRATRSITT